MSDAANFWWEAPEGEAHRPIFEYIETVEAAQSDTYERYLRLACLYDPYERMGIRSGLINWPGPDSNVQENVCKSGVDTVAAIIARNEPHVRFMTDGAEWSKQRQAKMLEIYAEGLAKFYRIHEIAHRGFKDGAIFGMGATKVTQNGEEILIERVLPDELVVDDGECRAGRPRQIHQRKFVDKDILAADYPKFIDEIEAAYKDHSPGGRGYGTWRWADYRPVERDQLVIIESWRLPYGKKGKKGYIPGRHVICIDGVSLLDEEWSKPYFPFAEFRWNLRTTGYAGCGLVEDIAGHQRWLNKMNWQIDRTLDQRAVPTTYVHTRDANLAIKATNRIGTIVPYQVQKPETVIPQAISGEVYARHDAIKASAYEFIGVSRMAATSMKPVGLESAPALREYRDITTERFAIQEKFFERYVLDITWLVLECCKELGDKAPRVMRKTRWGGKWIQWKDVDLGEVRVQMQAANPISRTVAGRTQTVIEWANAGVVTPDEARRLLRHPDLERAISLYTAALEDIERTIEDILDGENLVPEPFQNLKMGVWRMQMAYLQARGDGAPDEVLDRLAVWMEQAAWFLSQQKKAEQSLEQQHQAKPPIEAMLGQPPGMPGGLPPIPPGMIPQPPAPGMGAPGPMPPGAAPMPVMPPG